MIGIDSWDNNIPHYKTIPGKYRGKHTTLYATADNINAQDISNMKKIPIRHYFHLLF